MGNRCHRVIVVGVVFPVFPGLFKIERGEPSGKAGCLVRPICGRPTGKRARHPFAGGGVCACLVVWGSIGRDGVPTIILGARFTRGTAGVDLRSRGDRVSPCAHTRVARLFTFYGSYLGTRICSDASVGPFLLRETVVAPNPLRGILPLVCGTNI